MITKLNCPNCNKQFEPKNTRQIYCKTACKVSAWQKKKGIEKPEFLTKNADSINGIYEFVTKERQVPMYKDNPEYLEATQIFINQTKQIEYLRNKKNQSLKTLSELTSKTGLLASSSIGFLLMGLLTDSAKGAIVGSIVGALIGNEIEKSNSLELMHKIQKLEHHIFEIEKQISAYEFANTLQLKHLKSLPKKLLEMAKETYQEKVLIQLPLTSIVQDKPEAILLENESQKTPKNVVSLTDFKEMEFPTLNFNGKWLEYFGNPQGNFRMMIYGASGHGKSYFTAQLAEYLANNHGRVLYNAAEEGLNKSLQLKMSSLDSKYIDIASYKSFEELKKNVKKYRFVVIDSINEMNLKPNELKQIWELDKKRGIIYIMQVTKQGAFKGDNQFKHDADIIVNIENRLPNIEKNRYS